MPTPSDTSPTPEDRSDMYARWQREIEAEARIEDLTAEIGEAGAELDAIAMEQRILRARAKVLKARILLNEEEITSLRAGGSG